MKLKQLIYQKGKWQNIEHSNDEYDLILCFGQKNLIQDENWYQPLRAIFSKGSIVAASTAGEIANDDITDDCIVATSIAFEKSSIESIKINVNDFTNSLEAGQAIPSKLSTEKLRFVLVISDGSLVNGGDLVTGMNESFNDKVPVAGGLAGDGSNFNSTVVGLDEDIAEGNIVVVGFYGKDLSIGFGSDGGWSSFGPTRTITKSDKNVVYEIDDKNALDLYKTYLGDFADQLPGSALLFPLSLTEEGEKPVVRTILGIDQEKKSMTFAGNMPVGGKVRLMKTTLDSLVDAASAAAEMSLSAHSYSGDRLALLISCVGRKLVFDRRVDEELDAVRHSLGANTVISGFYSYGEIAPHSNFIQCQLHNQTMTITTLAES